MRRPTKSNDVALSTIKSYQNYGVNLTVVTVPSCVVMISEKLVVKDVLACC